MSSIRTALARIAGIFTGRAADDDLREELQAHVDMQTAENIRRGMHPDAARRQALMASGGLTVAAESVRAQRGLPWIESIVADVRYALRSLRHSRAFTIVVLLKPLPHRDGDRLVYLRQSVDRTGGENITFSVPEVTDFRSGAKSLGGIA